MTWLQAARATLSNLWAEVILRRPTLLNQSEARSTQDNHDHRTDTDA